MVLEELHEDSHPEHRDRIKRGAEEQDNDGIIMVYESVASGGDCGLNKFNIARLKVSPEPSVIKLEQLKKEDTEEDEGVEDNSIIFKNDEDEEVEAIYQEYGTFFCTINCFLAFFFRMAE